MHALVWLALSQCMCNAPCERFIHYIIIAEHNYEVLLTTSLQCTMCHSTRLVIHVDVSIVHGI